MQPHINRMRIAKVTPFSFLYMMMMEFIHFMYFVVLNMLE